MRVLLIWFLFIILIVAVAYVASSTSNAELLSENSISPLTPTEKHTVILVAPDGKVYFMGLGPEKKLWSFSSGPSVYSSYQRLPNNEGGKTNFSTDEENFYIDRGADSELYLHVPGQKEVKLRLSAEEFMKRTPYVSASGGVLLGSKKTSVFLVDTKAGKVRSFRSDNFPSVGEQGADETSILTRKDAEVWLPSTQTEGDDVEKPLYVTRTDYTLTYTSAKTGKVLWYLMFADVEASFRCEEIEDIWEGFSRDKMELISKLKRLNHCPTPPVVILIRDWSSPETAIVSAKSQGALPQSQDAPLGGSVIFLEASDRNRIDLIRDWSCPATMIDKAKSPDALLQLQVALSGDSVFSLPVPDRNPKDNSLRPYHGNENDTMLVRRTSNAEEFAVTSPPRGGPPQIRRDVESEISAQPHSWLAVLYDALPPVVIALFLYVGYSFFRRQVKQFKQSEDRKSQISTTKKRKGRRSAVNKQSNLVGKQSSNVSPNDAVRSSDESEGAEMTNAFLSPNFSDSNNSYGDGRRIGKLIVFNKEIAKGSNGTIVLEGNYDGRLVAVKRLVRTHHDVAVKEIQNLIASDRHPNIVRWYGVEYDQDFIYLSLERCMCSLHELISLYASQEEITNRCHNHEFLGPAVTNLQLLSNDGTGKAFELWKVNGYPSAGFLKLMRDVVCGLAHLHELGIIHRDLKPQNVLVLKDRSISAKISDMGISKLLDGDMSSLTKHATGFGSSGWQAPEQLRHERQTRAVDLFSLGCILFFCITGGKHPYGENLERDINIVNDQKDLFLIDNIPEATDLISQLLEINPNLRPKAVEVLNHPLFWNSEMRLSFLRDVSDRVELEDRENASELLEALESRAKIALGGKWDERMDATFLNDIGRYRRYKFDSVRDLLRVIRNKLNHFRELSKEIQVILGPVPEGFDRYFSTRFPKLLIEVYRIILRYCADEEVFHKYFISSHL